MAWHDKIKKENERNAMKGMVQTLAGITSGAGIAAVNVLSLAACSLVPVFHKILGRVSRLY